MGAPIGTQILKNACQTPFQKQIPKQTPHRKGPNPENAYGCTLWHDFQGSKAPQMPPKTHPKIIPKCTTCHKKSTRNTSKKTPWKMMPPAFKSIPKGSLFLSLGMPFSCHLASGCASCRPPAARELPDPQKLTKIAKKQSWNTQNS